MGWGTVVPAWAVGGVASDLLAFMAEGRRLWQDSWLHPQCPFACESGAQPYSPLLPSCTKEFPRLVGPRGQRPSLLPEPHLPAEPTAQPCPPALPTAHPQARPELSNWKTGWDQTAYRGLGLVLLDGQGVSRV